MSGIEEFFTIWDWAVLFGYLLLTTWVGHAMRGHQASIKDFFAGGRSLPWPAVSGSMIATEISGVTFIGVPGGVMAAQGDFTYLIWGLGSIMGRVVVGTVFTKVFYEDNIYSPYDYMGRRIKPGLKTLATVFFTIGSILAQSVRVLVAALPLMIVTGLSFEACIFIIGVFAIAWTLMGGMRTVIWTDVMQFFLFTIGGLLTVFWIAGHLDGGIGQIFSQAGEAGKTRWLNFDFGLGGAFQFTFWVAIIAVPFQNVGAFGVDQLNAQRMFCCKNAHEASKAIIWSSVGQGITYLMLGVGAALFVWYANHPPEGVVADTFNWQAEEGVPGPGRGDFVFPTWIVTQLPPGLSGLILGGVFAAAISSLDSILAALSQTTISVFYHPEQHTGEQDQKKLVRLSRMWVIIWGVFLTVFTLLMRWMKDEAQIPIIPLAFGMTAYTMGPLLGMFLCALIGKGTLRGLVVGSALSFLLVLFLRADVWILLHFAGMPYEWLDALPSYSVVGSGEGASLDTLVGFHWAWPMTTAITFLCGRYLFRSPGNGEA
ncbi:MAG: sodium:solute symporter family transporter [Luteolibacter sp.]